MLSLPSHTLECKPPSPQPKCPPPIRCPSSPLLYPPPPRRRSTVHIPRREEHLGASPSRVESDFVQASNRCLGRWPHPCSHGVNQQRPEPARNIPLRWAPSGHLLGASGNFFLLIRLLIFGGGAFGKAFVMGAFLEGRPGK